jgi:crossover junction endodeoxyribonuclease RusA
VTARSNPFADPEANTGLAPGPLSVLVLGLAAPQGSKRGIAITRGRGASRAYTGRVALVESSAAKVKTWRADVVDAATAAWGDRPPLDGPVLLRIAFVLKRPTSTPKTRPTPPAVKRPDLSKLVRSTEDALTTAGVYRDDSQVIDLRVTKRVAEPDETPGAWVDVSPCAAVPAPPVPTWPEEAQP